MTKSYLLNGSNIVLGKRIGRGGEGEVYLVEGDSSTAVKIYTGSSNPEREAKVKAMVQNGLAKKSTLVAFPKEILKTKSGDFAGFAMTVINGHRALHEVYGTKSRKMHYPKADFRFLIRAATNVARAVAQVHQSPCVIGDINHSGILVSEDATVAIIDADSFQLEDAGHRYSCLVGVPEFTPPELQGKNLKGVVRTKAHDHFGLAVAIFQMLFMGRHPYSGRNVGADLPLEDMIAGNIFPYSRIRKTNASPPAHTANLADMPNDVADAFERAFGLDPSQRPTAAEWVNVLKNMEGNLNRCAQNSMHYYPSHNKACPWCRMEAASGVPLFISVIAGNAGVGGTTIVFNIDKVWGEIVAIKFPDLQYVPQTNSSRISASGRALAAKSGSFGRKLFGGLLMLGGGIMFCVVPQAWFIWIFIIGFGWSRFAKDPTVEREWKSKFSNLDRIYQDALRDWQNRTGIRRLYDVRAELERAANEYRDLANQKSQELANLKRDRQSRQLNEYLDRFFLRNAAISGIGPAKVTTLASYGIESAADVNMSAILNIPGFGPVTASKIVAWRDKHQRKFVYNPAPLPSDAQAQAKVESTYNAKATKLIGQLNAGPGELRQLLNAVTTKMNVADPHLNKAAIDFHQVDFDLGYLGIQKPSRVVLSTYSANPTPNRTSAPNPSQSPARIHTTGAVQCPLCNAAMVRRTARRGRHIGKSFWGCSRYPNCKGTRS